MPCWKALEELYSLMLVPMHHLTLAWVNHRGLFQLSSVSYLNPGLTWRGLGGQFRKSWAQFSLEAILRGCVGDSMPNVRPIWDPIWAFFRGFKGPGTNVSSVILGGQYAQSWAYRGPCMCHFKGSLPREFTGARCTCNLWPIRPGQYAQCWALKGYRLF